jgi:hypothetical protein
MGGYQGSEKDEGEFKEVAQQHSLGDHMSSDDL